MKHFWIWIVYFVLQFGMFLVFDFSGIGGVVFCVRVLDFVWFVFSVDVFTAGCGWFVWWWSFGVLNLGFFFSNGAEECVMDSVESQGFRGVDESFGECFSGWISHSSVSFLFLNFNYSAFWIFILVDGVWNLSLFMGGLFWKSECGLNVCFSFY